MTKMTAMTEPRKRAHRMSSSGRAEGDSNDKNDKNDGSDGARKKRRARAISRHRTSISGPVDEHQRSRMSISGAG